VWGGPIYTPLECQFRNGLRNADCVWNVMAHTQKPDCVFRRNGRVHLNRQGRQFSRLLAAEMCASAVVMLDTPCSEVVWRVLATHTIRQFPLHFPSLRYRVPSHFNWTLLPIGTALDLGGSTRWGMTIVPRLWLLTDVFQLKIHWAEIQSCFVRVTFIFCSVLCG